MYVDDRVVVEGRLGRRRATGEIEVVLPRVLPPRRERLMMVVGAVPVIEEPQTEDRAGQSERPDLGVLSVSANGRRLPLPVQMCGDRGVGPRKGALAVANHLEWLVPAAVADHRPDPEQHQEEALVKEHAIGGDRVHLPAPWLCSSCGPARHYAVRPKLTWEPYTG